MPPVNESPRKTQDQSTDRLQDPDSGTSLARIRAAVRRKPAGQQCRHLVTNGYHEDDDKNPDHVCAEKSYAAGYEMAPSQRRGSTFSFRTSLASIVSTTRLAAVAGTAKLRSSIEQLQEGEERNRHGQDGEADRPRGTRGQARRPEVRHLAVPLHLPALQQIARDGGADHQRPQQPRISRPRERAG